MDDGHDAPAARAPQRAALTRRVRRGFLVAAVLLGLLAALANPWLVGRVLVPDGHITNAGPIIAAELALSALALLAAVVAWRLGRRRTPLDPRAILLAGLTVTLTVGLCFAAGELAVRLLLHPLRVIDPSTDAWWECRWRSEHVRGDTLLTRPKYGHDVHDPDLGWSPRPRYDDGRVRVNVAGLRADREYAPLPPPGVTRIVVAGDSYAWGENVANHETFAARLDALVTDAEVLNLGVHGYGTDQQLLRIRRDGFPRRPHAVVLVVFGPNVNRNVRTFRDYAKPAFRLRGTELELVNVPVPTPDELLDRPFSLPRSRLLALVRRSATNALERTRLVNLEGSERWRVTRAVLETARRECEAAGTRFLLVYLPWRVHPTPEFEEVPIGRWARETGTPYLSLREAFSRLPRESWETLFGGHFTVKGHDHAARAIAEALAREGIVPPGDYWR